MHKQLFYKSLLKNPNNRTKKVGCLG